MKINKSLFHLKSILIGILFFQIHLVFSQEEKNSALYKTIISKDSLLFHIGFNTCDVSQFENLLSDNFEFYHDKDSISNKSVFVQTLKKGLCGSIGTFQARRYLIPNSTEIYPLYKKGILYGAMQMGIHQFYEKWADKNASISNAKEHFGSTARFTHVWLLENGIWKLKRSFSYDHQNTSTAGTKTDIFDNKQEIEKWLTQNNVPTLGIGIINNGKLQEIKVFGELKKGIAAPYNTIWNVASLTKPITAIVALKLVSQGKWNLDE